MAPKKKGSSTSEELTVLRPPPSIWKLILCTAGIFGCYGLYGVAQEAIYVKQEDGSQFNDTNFLLVIQCLINGIIAAIATFVVGYITRDVKREGITRQDYIRESL